jgi:hypothetical protein
MLSVLQLGLDLLTADTGKQGEEAVHRGPVCALGVGIATHPSASTSLAA